MVKIMKKKKVMVHMQSLCSTDSKQLHVLQCLFSVLDDEFI